MKDDMCGLWIYIITSRKPVRCTKNLLKMKSKELLV